MQGGILDSLLFILLHSVADPRAAHFKGHDVLGLVVDDSSVNSVASHLFISAKTGTSQ